jgi:hypothetical protein
MKRLGTTPSTKTLDSPATAAWFKTVGERLNVYSGANDPTVAEVPENQWIVYHNTTIPEVRIWTNIAGTLKKSAAFT